MFLENRTAYRENYTVPQELFELYYKANAMIPQMSDGIKWIVHHGFLNGNYDPSLLAFSRFSEQQMQQLALGMSNMHQGIGIPRRSVHFSDEETTAQPIQDLELTHLWRRVRYSYIHGLWHLLNPIYSGSESNGFKGIENDLMPPSPFEIGQVSEMLQLPESQTVLQNLQAVLEIINQIISSPSGKSLFSAYRSEFKYGVKGSEIWRQGLYQPVFSQLVHNNLADSGIDLNRRDIHHILDLYNLT